MGMLQRVASPLACNGQTTSHNYALSCGAVCCDVVTTVMLGSRR